MRISQQQREAFDADAEAAFVAEVGRQLRARFPQLVAHLPEGALGERVRHAVARGRSRGFTWRSSLTGFAQLMFAVGPRFDEHPAFAEALAVPDEDENERIYTLHDFVTDADWRDAQRSGGEHAWIEALRRGR